MVYSREVPEGWEDVTIKKYIYLYQNKFNPAALKAYYNICLLMPGDELYFSEELIDQVINSLSLALDIPEEELEMLTPRYIGELCEKFLFFNEDIFKKKGKLKPKKEFKLLTVGEWVDLEELLLKGIYDSYYQIASKLVGINEKTSIVEVYRIVNDYLAHRNWLIKQYTGSVFSDLEDEEEEIKSDSWQWFGFMYNLAEGNFLDIHQVAEKNFIGALNFMAYKRTRIK